MKNNLPFLLILLATLNIKAQSPDFSWTKHFGGTHHETPVAISLDASGNIYTSGYFEETVDFDPGAGTYTLSSPGDISVYVSKIDNNGNFLWAKQITPPVAATNSDAHAWSHALCSNGDIYITGHFSGVFDFNPGAANNILYAASDDIFVVKLDAQGNYLWAKQFGGTQTDMANGIAVDASDAVYTTGFFMDTVDFDPGTPTYTLGTSVNNGAEAFVSKMDVAGNFVWAKKLSTTIGSIATDIKVDAAGNIFTTGSFQGTADFDPSVATHSITSTGDQDIYVWKLDGSGNFVWGKTMGGTTKEGGNSIITDASGNIFVSGFFTGTCDFDPGIGTHNLISAGNDDAFLLKLDATGNFMWANVMGNTGTDVTSALALDANGDVYTTGQFFGTVDFNSGPATYTLSASVINAFISKVDALGNFKWARQIAGGQSSAAAITIDGANNVYSTGYFYATADFDGNAGVFNITADGDEDIYIHKMICGNPPYLQAVSSNSLICAGNSATLTASGANTFTWNPNSTNPLIISPTITTTYFVSANDANGCSASAAITQSVDACTGLKKLNNAPVLISIYPNPTKDIIIVNTQLLNEKMFTIKVTNTLGQTVKTKNSVSSETILSLEDLPVGVYFLSIFDNDAQLKIAKVIKE